MCAALTCANTANTTPKVVLTARGDVRGSEAVGCSLGISGYFCTPMLNGAQKPKSDHSSPYVRDIKSKYYWKSGLNYRPYSVTSPSAKSHDDISFL